MIEKLRDYIKRCQRHADRLEMAEFTEIFYNQAFGALMFAIDAGLVSEEEALDLWDVELYDIWAELIERGW